MWSSLAPVIVGGAIGIVGGLVTQVWLERATRRADQRSLTEAIVGEVSAVVEICERRGYIAQLDALIKKAEAGSDPNAVPAFYFSARRNYFAVYDANLARLGILRKPRPGLVVRFYTQASSVLEDIADMREGKLPALNQGEGIRRLEEVRNLLRDTLALGRQAVEAAGSESRS
jgi:hypothetical protein